MFKEKDMSNVIGQTYGIYTIIYECDHKSTDGHRLFHVKCNQCGFETDMRFDCIAKIKECRHTKSSGVYIDSTIRWSNKRLKHIFNGMCQRCYNPNDRTYRWYGAKGIKICDDWNKNPLLFEQWALSHGYKEGLTINRIEEDKDYCPENCEWISSIDNAKYKSTTKLLNVDGIVHTGREWAEVLCLGTNTINTMLRSYPIEQVKQFICLRLQDPTKTRKSHQTWFNVYGIE